MQGHRKVTNNITSHTEVSRGVAVTAHLELIESDYPSTFKGTIEMNWCNQFSPL